jgi:hypothetical protein
VLIEGHFAIKAPISKVWDFLLNAQALASCVPGCEGVEVVDENTYVTSIKVKVGPISARFKMRLTIVEREPPRRLLTTGKGGDSKMASSLVSKNEIKLNVISEKETDFYYRSDVSVLGTLGKFGEGIMRKKAKDVGEQFAQALKSKLEMEQ